MSARDMTKAQCLKASNAVARMAGYRTFADLYRVVIIQGYCHSGLPLEAFVKAQGLFHAAQGLRWASEGKANRRAFVGSALRRIAPEGLDAVATVVTCAR